MSTSNEPVHGLMYIDVRCAFWLEARLSRAGRGCGVLPVPAVLLPALDGIAVGRAAGDWLCPRVASLVDLLASDLQATN